MKPIVIWGIGGHAREVAQLITDLEKQQPGRWALQGFLVDSEASTRHPKPLPAPVLGDLAWWQAHPDTWGVIAVGQPGLRAQIVARVQQALPRVRWATLVHPSAWSATDVELGEGSVVFAKTCLSSQVRVGRHASINLACTLSHDCVLGDCVSLGPGVHLSGGVQVGAGSDLGTGVCAIPSVVVGVRARVGAGAMLTRDVPDGVTVIGVPAKPR